MDYKNGCANETTPKLHFPRHRQDMEAQKGAKSATLWAKWRSKMQNRQL